MRKHHWRLPALAEFFPDNPGLLGAGSASYILWYLTPKPRIDDWCVLPGMSKFTESFVIR